jgi:diguanylate cyclase (GGDEF)-like protein
LAKTAHYGRGRLKRPTDPRRPTGTQRPTIAFFVNKFEGNYCEELCQGIIDAAEEHDVNLIIFPGWQIQPNEYNSNNNNVIYEYVNPRGPGANVDALVISSALLSGHISSQEFEAFVSRYKPLPTVSIGVPIEGVPSILTDNRPGFKQLLNHLIKAHGKRRVAFIKGLEGHVDAGQRFSVYREVLRENGIEYDPDLVFPGDFTGDSALIAMKLFDERKVLCDAIAAANDNMAFGVLEALRERNIRVPGQIAVTGFDNDEGAKHSSPSLTTVKRPIYEQSQKALEMALELLKGNQPESMVLDTEMVIRESCGCLSESLQYFGVQLVKGSVKLNGNGARVRIDSFINEELGKITGPITILDMIKSLIASCFQIFARDELEPQEVEELFRGFQSMADIPDLEENDIIAIQKAITTLNQWINNGPEKPGTPAHANWRALARERAVEDFFQKLQVFIADLAIKMQGSQLISHHTMIYQLRDVLVQMVLKIHDYHELLYSIIPRLRAIGIHCFYLYLYDQPIRRQRNEVWSNPPFVNLALGYNDDDHWTMEKGGRESKRLPWEKVIRHDHLPKKRYTLLLKSLFVEEESLGLILMELNMAHNYMYESLILEMSCAMRLSLLFYEREQIDNRLQEVVKELEDYNRKLRNISQTDELTGLYNRRGFFNLAAQRINQARKEGKGGLVFYADMDGLKKINDQYGHDEGDLAISAMAKILIKTFYTLDIIARLGGDEFAILAVNAGLEVLPKIKARLHKLTEEYNQQAGKDYQVSITIEAVPFYSDEDAGTPEGAPVTLENLISQADKMQYEQKKHKKESTLKE